MKGLAAGAVGMLVCGVSYPLPQGRSHFREVSLPPWACLLGVVGWESFWRTPCQGGVCIGSKVDVTATANTLQVLSSWGWGGWQGKCYLSALLFLEKSLADCCLSGTHPKSNQQISFTCILGAFQTVFGQRYLECWLFRHGNSISYHS